MTQRLEQENSIHVMPKENQEAADTARPAKETAGKETGAPPNENGNGNAPSSPNNKKVTLKEAPTGSGNDNNSNNSSGSSSRTSSKPGGYSADCSSLSNCSDSSSETSNGNRNDSPPKPNVANSSISQGVGQKSSDKHGTAAASFHSASSPFVPVSRNVSTKKRSKQRNEPKKAPPPPQWQGVRVVNPMDPRIDLSSVGMIPASSLYNGDKDDTNSGDPEKRKRSSHSQANSNGNDEQSQVEESPNQSTKNTLINQYNDLLNTLEVSSSIQALSHVNLAQDATVETNDFPFMETSQAANESDSSMVVLARVKRKYQKESISRQGVIRNVPRRDINHPDADNNNSMHAECSNANNNFNSSLSGLNDSTGALSSSVSSSQSIPNKAINQGHRLNVPQGSARIAQVQLPQAELRNLAPSIVTDSINGGTGTGSTGSDQARTESNSDNIKSKEKSDKKEETNDEAATLERLALKKRKRLDKRREYEEEVQRKLQESSDSSHQSAKIFKAGESITMEEALSFASFSRLIVQGTSPYLAVHVNAGFSRLTGMHNSGIIGRPLSKILSVIEGSNDWTSSSTSASTKGKPPECPSGEDPVDDKEQQNSLSIDRLMENSGFGSYHKVNTIDDKSDDKNGNSTSANEGSNNSSITSKDDSFTPIQCLMSICPIVSTSPQRMRNVSKPKKQDGIAQEPQLSKSLLSPSSTQHDPKRKRIAPRQNSIMLDPEALKKSHYLIQLTPCEDSLGSLEDKATGINEAGVQGDQEDNSGDSHSSSTHAVACG